MSVVSIAITVAILLAWLVPLIIGIKLLRGPQRTAGIVLTVLGVVWALPSIPALIMGTAYYTSLRGQYEPKDFDASTYRGATGIVRSSYRGPCKLEATSSGQKRSHTRYVSSTGDFTVPVGQHIPAAFSISNKPADGKEWVASSKLYQAGKIQVTQNTPVTLRAGPPYSATVKAHAGANSTSFALQLKDNGGNEFSLTRGGANPPPPQFQIVDKSGRVLFTGKFAYG